MTERPREKAGGPRKSDHARRRERARKLHNDLFPEEYDHMCDSISEAEGRRRGMNPMSADYISRTNERRAQLGFAPFGEGSANNSQDTYRWVLEKLRDGEEDSLITMRTIWEQEAAADERKREDQLANLQTEAWRNEKIDEMIASDAFLDFHTDRADPKVAAFRILGAIFKIIPSCSSEAPFNAQIRRVLPGLTGTEYDELYQHALVEWVEVYGY